MQSSVTLTSNAVSDVLKLKTEEILATRHKKGQKVNNLDVIAITEWVETKKGIDIFNILRAFALICNVVEGLETLFFTIAKELPDKLELNDLTTESIMENFENVNKDVLTPFDYIKTLQKIFKETKDSQEFVRKFEQNFLEDSLDVLKHKFKVISIDEYNKLISDKTIISSPQIDGENSFFSYANNIKFDRTILRKEYESE